MCISDLAFHCLIMSLQRPPVCGQHSSATIPVSIMSVLTYVGKLLVSTSRGSENKAPLDTARVFWRKPRRTFKSFDAMWRKDRLNGQKEKSQLDFYVRITHLNKIHTSIISGSETFNNKRSERKKQRNDLTTLRKCYMYIIIFWKKIDFLDVVWDQIYDLL